MKQIIIHKKCICFILAVLVLIVGICLRETQVDSSFALRMHEPFGVTLCKADLTRRDMVFAMEDGSPQDVIDNGTAKIDMHKSIKCGRMYDRNFSVEEKRYAILRYLQELDIRLCRTDNLTSVFTVLYIHHQDGVKRVRIF